MVAANGTVMMISKSYSRLALVVLSLTSVILALSNVRESAPSYWYLFFSPLMLGAYFYGLRGAMITTGATLASLALLERNAILFLEARSQAMLQVPNMGGMVSAFNLPDSMTADLAVPVGSLLLVVGALLVGYLVDQRRGQAERIHDLLVKDPLTGLSTRQHFIQTLRVWETLQPPEKGALGLIVFDLDHFGALQQRYGHFSGDVVLEQVSKRLDEYTSKGYLVARLGSDEFGIAYPYADPFELREVAKTLMTQLQGYGWTGELEGEHNREERVTASFGIALKPQDGETPGELLKSAWQALETQKPAGGNGYRFASAYPEIEREPAEPATLAEWREVVTRVAVASGSPAV